MTAHVLPLPVPTIRLVPGGWIIENNHNRTPGIFESRAAALLARRLTDADKQVLNDAARDSADGTGAIRYENVWGMINGTSNPRILEIVAQRRRRSELDLSGDSDIPDNPGNSSGSFRR